MEEWKACKLGDICTKIGSGATPSGGKEAYKGGKYNLIRSQNVLDFSFSSDGLVQINEVQAEKLKNVTLEENDVLLNITGDSVARACILPKHLLPARVNQHVAIIRPNKEILDYHYLLYYLQQKKSELLTLASGGATRNALTKQMIESLIIPLPPLPTQQKIAAILSSLDDKIELNNKINENLEQQAQALFKNWFVDFEPFGGKIPEGWKVGKLGDIVEETLNGDWGKDEPMGTNTEFVYCIRGADIPDVKVGNKGKMPKRYILPKNFESKHLVDGDLVIEISGGSPTQSTGRIAYISQALLNRYERKMVCTNFCKALKPIQGYQMFMYYYWQYLYERNVFFSYENGTTGIKNLDINGILENEEIAIPTIEALSDFNNFCNSFFMEIFSNGAQSEQLTNVRDSILPKLMNGEICI